MAEKIKLDPPPDSLKYEDPTLFHWLHQIYSMFSADGGVSAANVPTGGLNHNSLGGIFLVTDVALANDPLHMTAATYTAIIDGLAAHNTRLDTHDKLLTVTPLGVA